MSDRLKRKQSSLPDMDLKVFMNLMVVLIPMLLVSAEFARVSVIDISLPKKRGSTPNEGDKSRARESELLKLTAIITDSALTLGAKEGFLPSIHYKEYHKYITNEDNAELIIPVETGKNADHSTTGRQLHASERSEILLYACNENGEVKQCLYTRFGELLLNAQNEPVTEVKRGDEVYTLTNPKRLVLVKNPDDFVS
ncbi:MAG: ExbD/TolR family protein, partial [Chitinispirillaceae bacterium]